MDMMQPIFNVRLIMEKTQDCSLYKGWTFCNFWGSQINDLLWHLDTDICLVILYDHTLLAQR